MATQKPTHINTGGLIADIPSGDTIDPAFLPAAGHPFRLTVPITDLVTANTLGTGKMFYPCRFAATITAVHLYAATPSTSGEVRVDIMKNGTSIMATNKLNLDANENGSDTYSGTAAALTTTSWAIGDVLRFDTVTNAGTGCKGLIVTISGVYA